jgi:undecaprenyl-diphosphatase
MNLVAAAAAEGNTLGAALLGIIQGLTEFLPVSSSGHLVMFQQFFQLGDDHVLFDLVLHLGTLFVVLWFYRAELIGMFKDVVSGEGPMRSRKGFRTLVLLVIATIPTGLIGVLFEDLFERWFANPAVLVVTFAITGTVLFVSRWFDQGSGDEVGMKWWHAVILGVVQGCAITPGISRSGSTIVAALFLGLDREVAARFSFLMSVPAILGAVVFKLKDVGADVVHWPSVGVGALCALVSGYFSLVLLVRLVRNGRLSHFSWYCWAAAIAAGVIAWGF